MADDNQVPEPSSDSPIGGVQDESVEATDEDTATLADAEAAAESEDDGEA